MSSTPEISVVMANRNGAGHLSEAIASLQQQTLTSWELLFVDDQSSDGSVALAHSFAEHDRRIRLFTNDGPRGPAAARNRALAEARGRWIAIFDSDDVLLPERLQKLLAHALQTGAHIVADDLLQFSGEDEAGRLFIGPRLLPRARWIGLAEFVESNRLGSRMPDLGYLKPLIAGDLLRASGIRYDETLRIGEDYDLMARLLARGERLRLVSEALYRYRRHATSTSWRLSGDDVRALLTSHDRFATATRLWSTAEWQALGRRRRALETMLVYERVIELLKAGEYRAAAGIGVRHPRVWPLLTRPLRARLKRFAAAPRRHKHAVLQRAPAPGV